MSPLLFTCCGDTMTKATFRRKSLLVFTVSEFQRVNPWSSWWLAWQQAGRHGSETVAESLQPNPQTGGKTVYWTWFGLFETSNPTPKWLTSSNKAHQLIFPKQFYQIGTKHSNTWACWGHSHSNHYSFRLG